MIDSYVSRIFTFSGAGNDFVVLDGRQGGMDPYREPARIGQLCREYHTDGLMILTRADQPSHYDFVMEFYNPDGSGGMMCGNGGRCIVAFANYLGINPADGHIYHFLAPDGEHTAEILSQEIPGEKWTVRLKMIDVQGITPIKDGLFLNTGTRHYVQFVDRVDSIDMESSANGTWLYVMEGNQDGLYYTYSVTVDGKTNEVVDPYAKAVGANGLRGMVIDLKATDPKGLLQVDFLPSAPDAPDTFTDVYLTGPAELVAIVA